MTAIELLDTRSKVETPEGIEFDSSVAGPVPRALAYLVDLCWRALIVTVSLIIAGLLGQLGVGFSLIAYFLVEWFYPIYFEVFKGGQTPGKKAYSMRVVNDDFTPVSWGNSCIRNLLRAVDFLPSFYVFGLVSLVSSSKFQRLGDLAAGTLVIYTPQSKDQSPPDSIPPKPPSIHLNPDEQKAIADFTLRSPDISESRQLELASIWQPVLEEDNQGNLAELKAMGAWLLGRK